MTHGLKDWSNSYLQHIQGNKRQSITVFVALPLSYQLVYILYQWTFTLLILFQMNQVRFCISQGRVSAETRLGVSPVHLPYHLLLFITDSRAYIPSLKRSLSQDGFEPSTSSVWRLFSPLNYWLILITYIIYWIWSLSNIFHLLINLYQWTFLAAHKGVEPFFLHTLTTWFHLTGGLMDHWRGW